MKYRSSSVIDGLMQYWYRILVLGLSVWIATPVVSDRRTPSVFDYLEALVFGVGALITGMAWTHDSKDATEETAISLGALTVLVGGLLWYRIKYNF